MTLREFGIRDSVSDDVYSRVHHWLRAKYGKANCCEFEDCKGISTYFTWALKHGCRYEKKRRNFFMLCKSCHTRYDRTLEGIRRLKIRRKGKGLGEEVRLRKLKPVNQLTMEGVFVRRFASLFDAAKAVDRASTNICGVLRGRHRSAAGYKWEYEQKHE